MRRRNIVAALALIVGGVIYGYLASGLPERSLPNTPGPSFFPLIVTALLLGLSIALLVKAITSSDREMTEVSVNPTSARDDRRQTLLVLFAFLAYVTLLPTLGFIIATIPFFAFLMCLFGERRPMPVAAGALIMTAVFYGIFRYGFGVFLPRGLLTGIVI